MNAPSVTYRNLSILAAASRWSDLLRLCRSDAVDLHERREIAHVLAGGAPADTAAAAVESLADDDRGFVGPLWEVLAARPWAELAPHLRHPRIRQLVAHTRVLAGEDLRSDAIAGPAPQGAPFALQSWEAEHWNAAFDLPAYHRSGSAGSTIPGSPAYLDDARPLPPEPGREIEHPAVAALGELSRWATARAYRGTAWQAASAAASADAARQGAAFPFSQAYPSLVHLAAGESAYGRSRGQAVGRLALWRALSAMADSAQPAPRSQVTSLVERLRCVCWQEPDDEIWYVHVALGDPEQGVAWVVTGQDFD